MVEVHIGCVTANIPLMGPLFSRLGKYVGGSWRLSHKLSSKNGGAGSSHSSTKHTLKGRFSAEHGLQRMDDFAYVSEREGRTLTPTIEKGETHSDDEFELASFGEQGILVRRDLVQQSYSTQTAR